jgi:hypothetical protein
MIGARKRRRAVIDARREMEFAASNPVPNSIRVS